MLIINHLVYLLIIYQESIMIHYDYKMQIKIHVMINSFYIVEQFLIYTFPINLKNDLKKTDYFLIIIIN